MPKPEQSAQAMELERPPASIEEVPLLRSTLRVLKFWSILLRHNWRRYVCITPYLILNTLQFLDLYYSSEAVDVIVRNAYITVLFLSTHLRALLLCWKRFDYEHFMEYLRELYVELQQSEDVAVRKLLADTTKVAGMVTKINLLLGAMSVCGFLGYPQLTDARVLPFNIYVPGVDVYASPLYEIVYVLEVYLGPTGVSMYIPFMNLIVTFTLFGIVMCKVLQRRLRGLNDLPPHRRRQELIWCVRYQLRFVHYVNVLNELATYLHLVEFLLFGAMLCGMLFLFIIVETLAQKVIISMFILMVLSQSIVIYYYANELYDQSLAIAVAAYDCNWFDFDVETQKCLKLLLLRAQKPCGILVGNVYPMNLEMLQSLLNVTYSYFTLLKRVYG